MSSKNISVLSSLALVVGVVLLSACSVQQTEEETAVRESDLSAKSDVLWPVVNGKATIRVCWTKPKLATSYPVTALAPNIAALLVERKTWVRQATEAEWNARTPLKFIGWNDCTKKDVTAVRITPIDSATKLPCGADGQSCAEAFGRRIARKTVYINLFFGEEVRYASRYQQANPGPTYDAKLDMQRWWMPSFCMDEFAFPWSDSNTLTKFPVDVNQADNKAKFDAIYQSCLKGNALHELGHVAGLGHEQYRSDDPAAQKRCKAIEDARGIPDDFDNLDPRFVGDLPLGPFDAESIMSYCRLDKTPTLSTLDVLTMRALYSGKPQNAPNKPEPPLNENGGIDGEDGEDGEAL